MKIRIVLYCLFIAGIFATSASISAEKQQMPPADAKKVWNYMSEIESYSDWEYWPGHQGFLKSSSPHGNYVRIFANSPAIEAIKKGNKLPANSMIVKENFAQKDKETLKSITPMYKVQDYNPEQGNWFWAKYSSQGKVRAAGKVEACITCHKSKQKKDWIFHQVH